MKEFAGWTLGLMAFFLAAFIGLGVMLSPILAAQQSYLYWKCNNLSEMTGRDTRFVVMDTCYVQHNGEFIPKDRFIGIQGEPKQ